MKELLIRIWSMSQETRYDRGARSTIVLQYKCAHTKKRASKTKLESIKEVVKLLCSAK